MPVSTAPADMYEVITEADYGEISRFLESEPDESPYKGRLYLYKKTLKELLQEIPSLHVFVIKDAEKNIRAILEVQVRGITGLQEPKMWTNMWLIMKYQDWKSGDATYAIPLIDYVIKYGYDKYKLEKVEFFYGGIVPSCFILDLLKNYWFISKDTWAKEDGLALGLLDVKIWLS